MRTRISVPVALSLAVLTAVPAFAVGDNDDIAGADEVIVLPFSDAQVTDGATTEPGEPVDCVGMDATVWYSFRPAVRTSLVADTFGSTFDTVLAVYRGSAFDLSLVDCNDDAGRLQSFLSFEAHAGNTYFIQVGGYFGDTGALVFSLAEPGSISGTVSEAAGQPLADICVDAYTADRFRISSAATDEDGDYVVGGLPAGQVRVRFTDCGDYGGAAPDGVYGREWYRDKLSFRTADEVAVAKGIDTGGIDAMLDPRPRPDLAVTDLIIEEVPLRTSQGELPTGTGWTRKITIEATNIGNAVPRWTRIVVDACPRTAGSCKPIADDPVALPPGASVRRTYTWNGADTVGDVIVSALANTRDDSDWNNNTRTVDHFVHAGGIGVGIGPGCRQAPLSPITVCTPSI